MPQKIEHLVVLMLENRSFDHMLGFTRGPGYRVEGLSGDESNPLDPNDPASPRVRRLRPLVLVRAGPHAAQPVRKVDDGK